MVWHGPHQGFSRNGRVYFRRGCDRGESLSLGGVDGLSDIQAVLKVSIGRCRFSELKTPAIISKIVGGDRPACLQEVLELGPTDSMWDVTVRCWHKDPAQ